jgi:hypothetical protein
MKIVFLALFALISHGAIANAACTDVNAQTRIALEGVKALVALADLPNVVAYHGGIARNEGATTIVNVQPHFQHAKDWYKVSIRHSDCRVINIQLFAEKLPIN